MSTDNNTGGQGTTHRKQNQPGATTRYTKSSHEPYSRPTQSQGGSHQGVLYDNMAPLSLIGMYQTYATLE